MDRRQKDNPNTSKKSICKRAKNDNIHKLKSNTCTLNIGETYSLLTVIEFVGFINQRSSYLCKCSCGKEAICEARVVKTGKRKSCGCLRRMIGLAHAGYPYKDWIGKRFGRLVVQEYDFDHIGKSSGKSLICQCDCGNMKIARGSHLKSGNVVSCGCKLEEQKETFRRRKCH